MLKHQASPGCRACPCVDSCVCRLRVLIYSFSSLPMSHPLTNAVKMAGKDNSKSRSCGSKLSCVDLLKLLKVPNYVFLYFEENNLELDSCKVYSCQRVYNAICHSYKKILFLHHTDKGGDGDGSRLHEAQSAYSNLKQLYRPCRTIDLTGPDDESDDDSGSGESHDDSRSSSDHQNNCGVAGEEEEQEGEDLNPCAIVEFSSGVSREGESTLGKGQNAEFNRLIGEKVVKTFWFRGTIESARVCEDEDRGEGGHRRHVLYKVKYEDDSDEEELNKEELERFKDDCIEASGLSCGFLGATVWKRFSIKGTVEEFTLGETASFVNKTNSVSVNVHISFLD